MTEYIDRTVLLNHLKNCKGQPPEMCYSFALISEIERFVKSQPAADVVPVVHGLPVRKNRPKKYEWYEEVKTENGEILYRKHVYVDETNWAEYCPACGKRICSRFKSYCPSCGAIMDLKDKQV